MDWNGNVIEEEEKKKEKKEELIARYEKSCLYNWNSDEGQILWNNFRNENKEKKREEIKVEVFANDTQSTTEILNKENPKSKIAWLNMANAHNWYYYYYCYFNI